MEKKLTPMNIAVNLIYEMWQADEISEVAFIKLRGSLEYELIEEEKQEIIEAYKSGNALACDCYDAATNEDAIKYFTDTYETK